MNLTRNGICYDLNNTPYKHEVDGITYYFSSQLHKDKFIIMLNENRLSINYMLKKKFKMWFILNEIADLTLYSRIETRGFLVMIEGDCFVCLNQLILDGVKRIGKR